MVTTTAEMRWFFLGQLPTAVLDALSMTAGHRQPAHTDEYVQFPGCVTLGVKLREGRLEIKTQARLLGPERLAPGVDGIVETWIKLAFGVPDDAQLGSAVRAEAVTVAVDKQRWVRVFALDDAAELVEVAPGTTPAEGCNVELSQLRLRDTDWWSVGLVAFGDPAMTERCLRQAAVLALDPMFAG